MPSRYKIKSPIGPTFNTNPDDVWVVKKSLTRSGFYKTPDYGMTPYPDEELFAGIRKFQGPVQKVLQKGSGHGMPSD